MPTTPGSCSDGFGTRSAPVDPQADELGELRRRLREALTRLRSSPELPEVEYQRRLNTHVGNLSTLKNATADAAYFDLLFELTPELHELSLERQADRQRPGRPIKHHARAIGTCCCAAYVQITGQAPSLHNGDEARGPFFELVREVLTLLLPAGASAEYVARTAIVIRNAAHPKTANGDDA